MPLAVAQLTVTGQLPGAWVRLTVRVATVVPEAVIGEKDAVDDEGNIMPQGVDYGKITPELVAAIQELHARIEKLEAK